MSGTIPLSMTQQFDVYGQPLAGGALYIMQAGTVATPQNPYQDAGLTIVMPNPIILDAAGRIPQFFLADGYIKVRLTDAHGIVQLASDGILVIGPSAGGGGGGGVDPTAIMQTGDMKIRHDISVISGYVRCNGRTIGNSISAATELADTTLAGALFNYLWNKDTFLPLFSAGTPIARGASSAADFAAARQLGLPDWRGYAIAGLDDMGNTQANRLSATYFGTNPTLLGAPGGSEQTTIALGQIPAITSSGSLTLTVTGQTNSNVDIGTSTTATPGTGISIKTVATEAQAPVTASGTGALIVTSTGTSGLPLRTIGPTKLITIYMKL